MTSITEIQTILNNLSDPKIDKILKYCKTLNLIEENTNNKTRNLYNQRIHKYYDVWEYMTKDIIDNHKKLIEDTMDKSYDDILYRTRFCNIQIFDTNNLIEIFVKNHNRVIVADYLMFNKFYNLDYDVIDRILPYCKIKIIDDYTYKIDGWIFEEKIYSTPNYTIRYDDSNYDTMEFITTEKDKRLAVKLFIQVINETPEEYINFNNYNTILEWYNNNYNYINSYKSNIYFSETNYKNKNLELNTLLDDDLIIDLEDKFCKDEILLLLESNAKYSNIDIQQLGLLNISSVVSFDNININKLDLTDFYKNNGYVRTKSVIDYIKTTGKDRINCDNYLKSNGEKITKAELLTTLYNYCMPFGMGIYYNNNDNILKIEDATEILENNYHFDYLKGIALKISFHKFPIMDFKQFNSYNGCGKFMECIQKLTQ